MNKRIHENENGCFVTVPQLCNVINLGRTTVMNLAKESGSLIRIGGAVRVDREKFLSFVRQNYLEE